MGLRMGAESVPESFMATLVLWAAEEHMGDGSNSRGARPVHLIITMIQWIRTSRLSIKNSVSLGDGSAPPGPRLSRK